MRDVVESPDAVGPLVSSGFVNRMQLLWVVVPLSVLGIAIAWLISTDPLRSFNNGAPPVEKLTFERTILDSDGVRLLVRAGVRNR